MNDRRSTMRAAFSVSVLLFMTVLLTAGFRTVARSRSFQLFGTLVHRVPMAERRVALTFDDGPATATLDTILNTLGARGVTATFFLMGAAIEEAPGAAHRLVALGHELGNHTYSHRRMVLKSPRHIAGEVEKTDSLIRAAGHRGPIYFRPPYSWKFALLPWYLKRTGRTTVTCDVEPESYPESVNTSRALIRHVLERARPGSIILLHPWYGARAMTREAVGPLIDSLHARGFTVGPVRDLIATAGSASR